MKKASESEGTSALGNSPHNKKGEKLNSVLLVDDHAIMRFGVQRLLEREFPNVLVGEATNGSEALDLLRQSKWQVMVLDMMMPGCDGLEILRHIQLTPGCETKVIIFTAAPDPERAALALKAGACGYVTKCGSFDEIVIAVKSVLAGNRFLSRNISQEMVFALLEDKLPQVTAPKGTSELLSKRELDVLQFMAEGKSIKEISAILKLSVKTVSTYRVRMFKKLKFKSTADLVRYAVRENIIRN